MDNKFEIDVEFNNDVNGFVKHQFNGQTVTGHISMTAKLCNVEALLSSYNVKCYKIVDCDYPLMVMSEFKDIPDYYYYADSEVES